MASTTGSEKPLHHSSSSTTTSATSQVTNPLPPPRRQPHSEHHKAHGDLVRDFIIGFSDGLTVPFALTAGLSSLGNSKLVILGGLAELFSGAISMGLGAYLAGVTDRKHYEVEEKREWQEVRDFPEAEEEEIFEILGRYGIERDEASGVVKALKGSESNWVKFMMDFELRLEKPDSKHAWIEAIVMGLAYMVGGLLPMIPYFALNNVQHALFISIGITVFILVVFGYSKAIVTGCTPKDSVVSAIHTLLVGVVAAGVSYGIVKGINASQGGALNSTAQP